MRPAQSAVAARLAAAATTPPPLASAAGSAVCLNDAGQPVDWWLLYKTPGNCGASPWVRGNVTLYVDASTAAGCDSGGTCWQAGSIDRPDSALQRTLAQLTANGAGVAMYSDQPPYYRYKYTDYLPWAHAKGLLHFGATSGIWLRHSIPVWPNRTDGAPHWAYVPWPETCLGQHALCLSLNASSLDGAVAALLSKFKPYFYQASVPSKLAATYPSLIAVLADAADPSAAPGAPTTATFSTAGGVSWTAFAKGNSGPADQAQIFEDLVVPGLQASMGWQTWRTQFGAFGPEACRYDPNQSMNNTCGIQPGSLASVDIQNLSVPAGLAGTLRAAASPATAGEEPQSSGDGLVQPPVAAWRSCDDHSKWGAALPLDGSSGSSSGSGISAEPPPAPWVCFCDNNRELSQAPRGGACTCTEAASLWRAMAAVVQSAPDTCRQVAVNSGAAARRGRGGSSSWQRLLALPLLAAAVLATF